MRRFLIAVLASLGLVLLGTTTASADHGDGGSSLSQSADTSVCGQVTLSGTNDEHLGNGNPMAFGIVWTTEDGQSGTFGIPGEETVTFDEDINGGQAWVSYGVSVGAESDWYLPHDTAVVVTDCEAEPEPDPCEWDAELLADDELCVEPDPDPTTEPGPPGPQGPAGEDGQDGKDGTDGTDGKDADAAVPTAIPAGGKGELPKTGGPGLLALGGVVLTAAGGGLLALRRKFGW